MKGIYLKGKKKDTIILTCEDDSEVKFLGDMKGVQGFSVEVVTQHHVKGSCPAIIITKAK